MSVPLLYKPEAAAEELCVSLATMFTLLKSGAVESVTIGRSRRIPHAALLDYVARLRASTGSAPPPPTSELLDDDGGPTTPDVDNEAPGASGRIGVDCGGNGESDDAQPPVARNAPGGRAEVTRERHGAAPSRAARKTNRQRLGVVSEQLGDGAE